MSQVKRKGIAGEVAGQKFFVGAWWWPILGIKETVHGVSPEAALELLEENHVSELFLDASGMYPDDAPPAPRGASVSEVRAFAGECYRRGIRLSALTGCSRDGMEKWMDPARGYPEVREFIDLVADYNNQVDEHERFVAVHLDIEPHSTTRFRHDREAMMQLYADTMAAAARWCHEIGLKIETDVCGDMRDTDLVMLDGKQRPIMDALFSVCDTITVMAYRREAWKQMEFGTNRYLPYAKRYNKRLVVGSETMEPQYDLTIDDIPKEITYASVGREAMLIEMDDLQRRLLETGADNVGIAVHHVHSWYPLFHRDDPLWFL